MNKLSKTEIICFGLFYGGIWGFLEATLGYVLNMIPIGISGGIMFPIAYILMTRAYEKTGSLNVLSLMTVITALIKLTNLALPFLPVVKVVNPAFAILLEGFSVVALFKFTVSRGKRLTLIPVFLTCMLWRVLYLADVTVLYYINIPSRMIESGFYSILEYLMLGIINTLVIFLFIRISEFRPSVVKPLRRLNPLISAGAVVMGILFQYLVRI